ncbi:DUF305 domain-containing protein [Rhodococcus antarcticus]|uniref:DUF305 domain-containing protein n=1 Tax=Rhodococcus antarcticus TaxID=2987751 RepID=A0ABY6P0F6_9NOCA|nr:DUF305 domain-containing protein [Rhodococcus antarcticus]UZJ25142.1 DUF305 domain-containing protein [Rhodococcus antarcticus]
MKLRTALPAVALAVGLTVAGCSSDTPTSSAASSSSSSSAPSAQAGVVFNDADVTFLTDMYPHHAQALEMATMVDGRSTNQAVIDLATQIKGAQQPEMDTMTGLLTSFGKPTPSTDSSMGGMDMSGTSGMSGMMSSDDMTRLSTLSGAAFDKTWLTMMTEHHSGAVDMANVELSDGSNTDAKTLATAIITAQNAEIATMKGLLAQL